MLMQAVDPYLAMRRAVGFALDHTEGYLRNFARFALARGDTHIVAATAVDWASLTTSEAQRRNRLHTVIRFARFMAAEDSRHEIPPEGIFWGRRQRPMPYIFSDDEIEQLLSAASRLGPPGSLRPQTYSTLFGLLAVTGMRVSEARNLHLHDVTIDGLLIRETKFHKSRLLPLHVTTRTALDRYIDQRRPVRGDNTVPHVFLSAHGRAMTRMGFTHLLHKYVCLAAQECPSLHEKHVTPHVLRHTCAMIILQATGDLRKVSLWLGHADMQTTAVYLRADPTEKIAALEAVMPPALRRGAFTVPDKLIASLQGK